MAEPEEPTRVDFQQGVVASEIRDGSIVLGHSGSEDILVIRRGNEFFALAPNCSHYGGPLAEGIVVGDTIRCPWHHACFSLRTGEATRPPALEALACWKVEIIAGKIYVHERKAPDRPEPAKVTLRNIVIIGGGAAGNAAAEMLRREGYAGHVVMVSADSDLPYDRPALSKDYLEGRAQPGQIAPAPSKFLL